MMGKHYQHAIKPISDLIPYALNSRTHSDEQINQIAASIREFGFTNPVLIDEQGGIVAGHGRVMAAKKLGIADAPCIILEGLTAAQKKAYVIADNQLPQNAGWDLDLLKIEIDSLKELEFDVDLLGFSDDELEGMFELDEAEPLDDMPSLPDGDKEPFQQMTFTLHDEQAEQVQAAIAAAKSAGPFVDSPNENSNGNALARICETYLTAHA